MEEKNNPLNKFLKFVIGILKERYDVEDECLGKIEFEDREKEILKKAVEILGSADKEILSNFPTTFGLQGKDCKIPLKSIFSEVSLSKPHELVDIFIYPELDKIPFPQSLDENKTVISNGLKNSFLKDYKTLYENKELNNNTLLFFIEKYGGFIPVNGYLQSTPFYDYVKVLGAVYASLLAQKDNYKDPKLILIGGDLSGIQDFIFSISSKGALKSYRARSFYLGMLSEHIVNEILERLDLSDLNTVYNSGGRFLILSPDISNSNEIIGNIRKNINEWLFDNFRGLIYFSIDFVPLREDIKESLEELENNLESLKTRKFSEFMGKALEPKEPIKKTSEDECEICYNDLDEDVKEVVSGVRACKTCRELFNVGRALGNSKYVLRLKNKTENIGAGFEINRTHYCLIDNIDQIDDGNYDKAWIINSFDISDFIKFSGKKPSKFLLGNYLTKVSDLKGKAKEKEGEEFKSNNPSGNLDEEDTASFTGLAFSSIGLKRLAVLRMDVDNLGTIFSKGLPVVSFPRVSALSRLLDYYFKYYMNSICAMDTGKTGFLDSDICMIPKREVHRRPVSIIFSGGDDLLIVGAWNEAVELAYDIEKTFNKFVCNNPDITISGGLSLSHYKYPFNKAQNEAKVALEFAKENYVFCELTSCRSSYNRCPFYDSNKCLIKKSSITMFFDLSLKRLKENKKDIGIATKWSVKGDYYSSAEEIKDFVQKFVSYFGKFDENENKLTLEKLPRLFIRKLLNIYLLWATGKGIYVIPLIRLMNNTEESLKGEELNEFTNEIKGKLIKEYFLRKMSTTHILLKWIEFLTRSAEG